MKCLECRGACCETFTAEIYMHPPNRDAQNWLELHATVKDFSPKLTFECRCTKLTSEGTCSIYEDRPLICELYIAGGKECLDTVRSRRTPEQYARIRDDGDPLTIHPEEAMSEEIIRKIDDLIAEIEKQDDPNDVIEMLEEMSTRADTAKDAAEESMNEDDEADDVDAEDEEDENDIEGTDKAS